MRGLADAHIFDLVLNELQKCCNVLGLKHNEVQPALFVLFILNGVQVILGLGRRASKRGLPVRVHSIIGELRQGPTNIDSKGGRAIKIFQLALKN